MASVVAAIIGLWGWQENWVRFAATAETLKSELVKFDTRTGPYSSSLNEEMVLDSFVARIESLASNEVAAWSDNQSAKKAAEDEHA
jgi:hypothetical protein